MSTEKTTPKPNTTTPAEQASTRPVVAPPVDIYENAQEYLVLADVPGVDSEGIQIRFEDGELTIKADRAHAPDGDYVGTELLDADYYRRFVIPETVDSEKIDAKLIHGVLHLVLPKASKARPRQISVKAN